MGSTDYKTIDQIDMGSPRNTDQIDMGSLKDAKE
jgi:hypothetical protein